MTTITINLDDDLARHVEESARREHKSVSEWVRERLMPEAGRAAVFAALEERALANGHPPGWITLFGSWQTMRALSLPPGAACVPQADWIRCSPWPGSWIPTLLSFACAASQRPRSVASTPCRPAMFLAPFLVAWPNATVEAHYVAIRTHLEALGTPISEADLWIAATVLVTTYRYNCLGHGTDGKQWQQP